MRSIHKLELFKAPLDYLALVFLSPLVFLSNLALFGREPCENLLEVLYALNIELVVIVCIIDACSFKLSERIDALRNNKTSIHMTQTEG